MPSPRAQATVNATTGVRITPLTYAFGQTWHQEPPGWQIDYRMRPKHLSVTGPSGVGKTTVIAHALARSTLLQRMRMVTDRPPRLGEQSQHGQFEFVSSAVMTAMERDGLFAAVDRTWGEYRYGITHAAITGVPDGCIGIAELGPDSLRQLEGRYQVASALLIAPTFEILGERLRIRGGMNDRELRRRMALSYSFLSRPDMYDFIVMNSDMNETVADILAIARFMSIRRRRFVIEKQTLDQSLEAHELYRATELDTA